MEEMMKASEQTSLEIANSQKSSREAQQAKLAAMKEARKAALLKKRIKDEAEIAKKTSEAKQEVVQRTTDASVDINMLVFSSFIFVVCAFPP